MEDGLPGETGQAAQWPVEKAVKHELEIVATPFRSLVEKIAKESWKTHNPAATRNIVQVSLQFCIYYLVLHETRVKDEFYSAATRAGPPWKKTNQ